MEKPKFIPTLSGITIQIPSSYIVHLAETSEELAAAVNDRKEFNRLVCEQLESELLSEPDCNSPTKFNILLDEAITEVIETGPDCVNFLEQD